MKSLIISAGIRKAGQLLLSAALAVTVIGAFGTTALVAYFARDLVADLTIRPVAFVEPQPMLGQVPPDFAITLDALGPP